MVGRFINRSRVRIGPHNHREFNSQSKRCRLQMKIYARNNDPPSETAERLDKEVSSSSWFVEGNQMVTLDGTADTGTSNRISA